MRTLDAWKRIHAQTIEKSSEANKLTDHVKSYDLFEAFASTLRGMMFGQLIRGNASEAKNVFENCFLIAPCRRKLMSPMMNLNLQKWYSKCVPVVSTKKSALLFSMTRKNPAWYPVKFWLGWELGYCQLEGPSQWLIVWMQRARNK